MFNSNTNKNITNQVSTSLKSQHLKKFKYNFYLFKYNHFIIKFKKTFDI